MYIILCIFKLIFSLQVNHLKTSLLKDTVAIHNFSVAGATAEDDLEDQLSRYLSLPSKPWTSSPKAISYGMYCPLHRDFNRSSLTTNSRHHTLNLPVFFLGINDCGRTQECLVGEVVEKIKEVADRLYTDADARNFVFVDVPPIDRSPQGAELGRSEIIEARVQTWNEELQTQVSQFVEDTPTAKVSCFSIHDVLSAVLDDPEEYDFTADDTTAESGEIWADDLHLTSSVHRIIAERMMA
ncbi:hypothetical protein AAF712_005554 [Marasmius tenuissimus]|uniref:SGNH hydrolase-type esterase domain-containing protein n=1 Tax=Marasmius tenuissimus TaxID=585030 RepID=A0ABR3A1W3_9AGAR